MINVLIVEDDPMVAEINKRYLLKDTRIGTVEICSNGNLGWYYLNSHTVDLVLLDVYMPQVDGLELLKMIRSNGIDTDVILVTAANNSSSIELGMRLGVIDYLVKPFEYDRFQSAINRFFEKRKMLLDEERTFSQEDTDALLGRSREVPSNPFSASSHASVEKGINIQTLDIIVKYLEANKGKELSGGEIAAQVDLSRVTVHKYLNYLEREGRIKSRIDYKTEGRPRTCYYI